MRTKKTNWRKEFAPFRPNSETATELVKAEKASPGYLSDNEREFVAQVLGPKAFDA